MWKKIDGRWKESIDTIPCEMFIKHSAHCGRLWVVEVSCQVQINFLKKTIIFLIWKCHFFPLILPLFLPGVVKSTTFCTLCLLFNKVENFKSFFCQIETLIFQLQEIAVTVCKRQWIWQLLVKIEIKWVERSGIFRLKKWYL